MSDLHSVNTVLEEIMIASKNEHVFIHDLGDLTLQIIFGAWWASVNVGSKHSIAWNIYRHPPFWQICLRCAIEETSSPGIICIMCHQVLHHPPEHGTGSRGKHLLAKAHIAKLNKLTESEVSGLTRTTVYETALPMQKRHSSWGITILSSQRKFIFVS